MKIVDRGYQFYKDLPPWAKGMVIVGGAAIAWFGIVNPVRKLIKSKLDIAKMVKEGKDAASSLNDLAKKGVRPTITSAQAEGFCNSLVKAFGGCGTDEDAVYNVMSQMRNEADVYLLINKFGVRKYEGCGWWNVFQSGQELSLSGAISDELDATEKQLLNGILSTRGIKFRFT